MVCGCIVEGNMVADGMEVMLEKSGLTENCYHCDTMVWDEV